MLGHKSSERLQGIPRPCCQCGSCRQMVCMFEKSKPRFLQAHRVPQRSLPCQPLAQVTQTRPGRQKNKLFLPTLLRSAPLLHGVGRRVLARWWGGPQGCRQPRDECCPPLFPALHCDLPLFLHCSSMDWEHSIIFWLYWSHISLKSKRWMWFSTGRWKVERMWQWVDLQRMVNLWASRFLEEWAQKLFLCITSCSLKCLTSNSRVCKVGDWLSYLMLFKICCFPLTLACLCFYRNPRQYSNFPNRYGSPSLEALEDVCSNRENSLYHQFCESTRLGYQLLCLTTQIIIYVIVSLSLLNNHFYGDDLSIYIKIAVHKVNCVF